ncbi:hypothetical protein KSS87_002059, partial [Heliosperma pusillum]
QPQILHIDHHPFFPSSLPFSNNLYHFTFIITYQLPIFPEPCHHHQSPLTRFGNPGAKGTYLEQSAPPPAHLRAPSPSLDINKLAHHFHH